MESSGRLKLVNETTHPDLDFGLSFDFSHGHTLGMLLSRIDLPSGPLVYPSDLIPGASWIHLPITTGYDRFAELVVDEKKNLMEKLARENGRIVFRTTPTSHMLASTKMPAANFFMNLPFYRFER